MNSTLSIPQVPEILTGRFYTIQSAAAVGTNHVQINRRLENSFEVVTLFGNAYLLTGAVDHIDDIVYYEIYPALLKPVALGDNLYCVQSNTNNNQAVLSTSSPFDIYSKFFKLIADFKEYTEKLGAVNIPLPLNNYQLAVRNGFSGTEMEWLESLKGADGNIIDVDTFVLKTIFNSTIADINERLDNISQLGNGYIITSAGDVGDQFLDVPALIDKKLLMFSRGMSLIISETIPADLNDIPTNTVAFDSETGRIAFGYPLSEDEILTWVWGENGEITNSTPFIFIDKERPTGAIDNVNKQFELSNLPILGSDHVYRNGILQFEGVSNDYIIVDNIITFSVAPVLNVTTGEYEIIQVTYRSNN